MKVKFSRPTIYMSHPIRGEDGNIEENCKKASAAARRLRRCFPEVDFYVPAEHDLTLQILYDAEILTVDEIMMADLKILAACHGWMYYKHQESAGSEIEMKKAQDIGLTEWVNPWKDVFIYDIEKLSFEKLRTDFSDVVRRAKEVFKNRPI